MRGWRGPRRWPCSVGPSTRRLAPPPAGQARPPGSHSQRPNLSKLLSAWPDLLSGEGGARCCTRGWGVRARIFLRIAGRTLC